MRSQPHDFGFRQRPAREFGVQRDSRYVFGHQEVHVILVAKFKDGFDVGVVQFGERQRLLAKSLACSLVRQHTGRKDFESHVAVELLIMGTVDNTHTARTNLLENAVVTKRLADVLARDGHRARAC